MFQIKRFWRKLALILGWSVLVISLGLYIFWVSLEKYSEQLLVDMLQSQISSDYIFDYQDFRIDLQHGALHLEGLSLKPVPDSVLQRKSYEFFLPKVVISIFSFQKIIKERALFITNARIWDPEIRINNTPSTLDVSFSKASVSFLELISNYLFKLEIDRLEIEGGELLYQNNTSSGDQEYWFDEIGLLIDQFAIDTSGFRHNFLNAQNISLNFSGHEYHLPDSIHVLSFENGFLLTNTGQLGFKNLQLKPEDEQKKRLNPAKNYFDLNLPEIRLSGIDFNRFYAEQDLDINTLFLDQPSFVLSGKAKTDQGKNPEQNALRWLLNLLSPNLSIHRILIKDGYADLDSQAEKPGALRFKLDSVAVYDFHIDPQQALFERGDYPFRKITIGIRDASKAFQGNGEVMIKHMFLDSETKEVILREVELELPNKAGDFALTLPKIKIEGVDIWTFLLDQEMEVGLLSLETPEIQWSSRTSIANADSAQNKTPFLAGFPLKLLKSRKVELKDAKVKVDSSLKIEGLNLLGIDLRIDESTTHWADLFQQFKLGLKELAWESSTQSLGLDSLFLDGQDLTVEGLEWLDKLQDDQIISIPKFRAQNLNLDTLLKGQIAADTIQLIEPFFKLNLPRVKNDRTNTLPLQGFVSFINAQLDLNLPGGHLNAENIFLDLTALEEWNFALSRIGPSRFLSKDEDLEVRLKGIIPINKQDAYRIETVDLKLYPQQGKSDSLQVQFDQVRAYGFDWPLFREEGVINFQRIVLDSSRARTHFSKTQINAKVTEKNSPSVFPKLRIDTLLILNNTWSGAFQPRISSFLVPDLTAVLYAIDFTDPNWSLDLLPEVFDRILLEAPLGLELDISDAKIKLGPFSYNRKNDLARLSKFEWNSKTAGALNVKASSLQMIGLPSWSQVLQDSIVFKEISFNSAVLEWTRSLQDGKPKDIHFPIFLAADVFSGSQINFKIQDRYPIEVQGLSFRFDQFFMDSSFQVKRMEDYYQDLAFSIDHLDYTLDSSGFYSAQHDLHWNKKKKGELSIDSFKLVQNMSWENFTSKSKYRKDYWSIDAYRLSVIPSKLSAFFQDTTRINFINFGWVEARDFNDETKDLRPAYNKMLHQNLLDLSHPFAIDSVNLGGNLTYTAIAPLTNVKGSIDFNYLYLAFKNISNIPQRWGSPMHLKASGMIYKEAPFWVDIDFDLADSSGAFKMEGRLDAFDLKILNPILRPQAAIEINKGANRRILFNLAANDQVAVGDMIFRYRGLGIQILDKNNLEKQGFSNSFVSFWANRLVNTNNPSWLRKRQGLIYFERDQQKAISHFWAHSLLSGLVNSIGMQNNKKQLRKSEITDVVDLSYPRLLKEQLKEGKN